MCCVSFINKQLKLAGPFTAPFDRFISDVDSGSTTDWAHGYHKTPLSMCFEFRDNGAYGFVLPADQIIPNAEETLDALIAMLAKAKTMGYFQRS